MRDTRGGYRPALGEGGLGCVVEPRPLAHQQPPPFTRRTAQGAGLQLQWAL